MQMKMLSCNPIVVLCREHRLRDLSNTRLSHVSVTIVTGDGRRGAILLGELKVVKLLGSRLNFITVRETKDCSVHEV